MTAAIEVHRGRAASPPSRTLRCIRSEPGQFTPDLHREMVAGTGRIVPHCDRRLVPASQRRRIGARVGPHDLGPDHDGLRQLREALRPPPRLLEAERPRASRRGPPRRPRGLRGAPRGIATTRWTASCARGPESFRRLSDPGSKQDIANINQPRSRMTLKSTMRRIPASSASPTLTAPRGGGRSRPATPTSRTSPCSPCTDGGDRERRPLRRAGSIEEADYYPWQYGVYDELPVAKDGRAESPAGPGWGITVRPD